MQQDDQSQITQIENKQDINKESIRKKSLQSEKTHLQLKKAKTRNTIIEQHEDEDLVYERVKQSRFKQQRLPAWRPVPTITSIFLIFFLFGIIFNIFGIILLVYSKKIRTIEYDYTNCNLDENETNICYINETINKTINKPVYIYYQLDGFYQNSRRYVKSKNLDQLRGKSDSTEDCDHFETNDKMELLNDISINGKKLNMSDKAIPCGLIAKTFFNDTYNFSINNENITVIETGISYDNDRKLYKNNYEDRQWFDMTNEHFIVWMRPAGLPNPRKIWGKIDRDLKEGDNIIITIENNYPNDSFDRKKIILSNVTNLGGNNTFLGTTYIVFGCLSILCSIIFPIGYKIKMAREKEKDS